MVRQSLEHYCICIIITHVICTLEWNTCGRIWEKFEAVYLVLFGTMDYFRILVWNICGRKTRKQESWNVLGKCVGKIFGMYMKERIGCVGTVQSLEDAAYGCQ
jgi:hypothetical protein